MTDQPSYNELVLFAERLLKERNAMERALKNIRLYARKKRQLALHEFGEILRFCEEAGVKAEITREEPPDGVDVLSSERDALLVEVARLRKALDAVMDACDPECYGCGAYYVAKEARGLMEKQRDDARAEVDRLRAEANIMRDRIAVLREALEDIREWAHQDDVRAFEDGDIPLADFCDRALKGEK